MILKNKKLLILSISVLVTMLFALLSYVYFRETLIKNSVTFAFANSLNNSGEKLGAEYLEGKNPKVIVQTTCGENCLKYSLVYKRFDSPDNINTFAIVVFRIDNLELFQFSAHEESTNYISHKTFDQVVELAKKTDIGMINRKITNYDNGDDCFTIGCPLCMYNCRKAKMDEGYDPDISTYRAITPKEEEELQRFRATSEQYKKELEAKEDERISKITPPPFPFIGRKADVEKYINDIDREKKRQGMTPERCEEAYHGLLEVINNHASEQTTGKEELLQMFMEFLQVDENGKYIGPSLTPTPIGN